MKPMAVKSAPPKKLKLYYDIVNKAWCIKYNRTKKIKAVYWGGTKAPLQAIHSFPLTARAPHAQLYSCISGYQARAKSVYAGPLIGIIAAKGSSSPFSGNWKNFLDLMRMGRSRGGIVYIFTPEEIDWQNEQIQGWIYQPDVKRWRSLLFPFPNVIYNRISTRKQENTPEVQEALRRFQFWGDKITLFNPHFFNKQEIFQILGDSEELAPFLPDTQPLTTKQDLVQMLQKHPSLYLKPTKSKAGLGILKISRMSREYAQDRERGQVNHQAQVQQVQVLEDEQGHRYAERHVQEGSQIHHQAQGQRQRRKQSYKQAKRQSRTSNQSTQTHTYLFTVQEAKQVKHKRTTSITKLWNLFQAHRISSPYIVQQGIESAQLEGCPFDFRVLVQKDRTGEWGVTGIGTRVAGEHRITTHVPRGGRIESSSYVLEQTYPDQAEQFLEQIKQLTLACAHELEHAYGELGEMSMDIGLDQQGKLWFFEANSKPMKFDEPCIRLQSLKNIIDYSKHLTFSR